MAEFITPPTDGGQAAPTGNLTQPIYTSPSTPPPSGNRFTDFLKRLGSGWMKYLLLGLGVALIAVLVFGYIVIAKGQTAIGEKIQDRVWQAIIDDTSRDQSDIEGTVKYVDQGTFKFQPSHFLKSMKYLPTEISESEFQELDNRYAFTLQDFNALARVSSYVDVSNRKAPQTDMHVEGVVSNNRKDFEASFDVRLKEKEAYARYDYNTNVEDLLNYLFGGLTGSDSKKNRWIKTTDDYALQNLRDSVLTYTLLKDPASSSQDSKRLADIRQMASALELYYNDNNSYPNAKEGKPEGLTPVYISQLPTAPTPPGGQCSEDLNTYHYEVTKTAEGRNTDYLLSFCLGSETGGLKAGNQKITSAGMEEYKDCPSSRQCAGSTNSPEQASVYKDILKENRVFDIKTLKGFSRVNGKMTAHYSMTLNKDNLRNIINDSIDKTMTGPYDNDIRNFTKEVSNALLDKIELQNYEVWVGLADRKMYKSTMTWNAISLTEAADYFAKNVNDPNNPINQELEKSFGSSQATSRDAKRIADARQMASALELYFNDNNSYPPAQDGKPAGLVPNYLGQLPTSPTPADGTCDDYNNTYWYTQTAPAAYTFTFCIGKELGGLGAGINTLSQNGIASANPPSGAALEQPPSSYEGDQFFESFKSTIINTIREMDFNAQIQIDFNAKSYGEKREIETPTGAIEEQDTYQY